MDKLQIIILISLISISMFAWIISKDQPDMMKAMMTLDPSLILLFIASWTVGMVAMMFPAISAMVLLYNRLIKNDDYDNNLTIKWTEKNRNYSNIMECIIEILKKL